MRARIGSCPRVASRLRRGEGRRTGRHARIQRVPGNANHKMTRRPDQGAIAEASAPAPSLERPVEPVSHAGRLVSEEEYWRTYYLESDIHYEWNNGRLEEKPVSDYETFSVYEWFIELLRCFLRANPIARMVALEMGFRLPLPGKTVIRKPDLGVVHRDNPQPLLPLDCSYHGVFDLCIEALSDKERSGIERDTRTKKSEYAAGGVPEYYILHRTRALQSFYTLDSARGVYVPIEPVDQVIHSRVLPGFRFRVTDLGRRPNLETLRSDALYGDFVLPGWREAEERAEAEAERAKAEAERARAEASARAAAEDRANREKRAREDSEAEVARLRALLASKDRQ